jgi:hypothetical protein
VPQLAPAPEAVEPCGGILGGHSRSVAVRNAGRLTNAGQFACDRAAAAYGFGFASSAPACGTPAAA